MRRKLERSPPQVCPSAKISCSARTTQSWWTRDSGGAVAKKGRHCQHILVWGEALVWARERQVSISSPSKCGHAASQFAELPGEVRTRPYIGGRLCFQLAFHAQQMPRLPGLQRARRRLVCQRHPLPQIEFHNSLYPAQANNMVFYGGTTAQSCRDAALAAAKQSLGPGLLNSVHQCEQFERHWRVMKPGLVAAQGIKKPSRVVRAKTIVTA